MKTSGFALRLVTVAAMLAAAVSALTAAPAGAVTLAATTTTVTTPSSTVTWSSSPFSNKATFTATVKANSGTPGGTVTFKAGSDLLCLPVTLSSGTASCATAMMNILSTDPSSATAVTVTATYSGSSTFAASSGKTSVTVEPSGTTTTSTTTTVTASSSTVTWSSSSTVTFTATVAASSGSSTPGGTVSFTAGSTTLCKDVTLSSGQATCTVPVSTLLSSDPSSATAVTVTATYSGSSTFASSSGTTSVTVESDLAGTSTYITINPSTITWSNSASNTVTLTATVVASGGSAVPGGTVTFAVGSNALCKDVTLSSGKAACKVPVDQLLSSDPSAATAIKITATYSGNSTFAGSSEWVGTMVEPATATIATTTTITASPSKVVWSGSSSNTITFTATVRASSGGITPTDSASFTAISLTLCKDVALSSGAATCTVPVDKLQPLDPAVSPLDHVTEVPVTATYSGGPDSSGGTISGSSDVVNEVVNPAPGVTWGNPLQNGMQSPANPGAISCPTAAECVLLESFGPPFIHAYYTSNSGQTWSKSGAIGGMGKAGGVSCPSASDCVAVGMGTGTYGGSPAADYSTDGGKTWSTSALDGSKVGEQLLSVSCPSTSECVAVGNNGSQTASFSTYSTDGGKTWSAPVVVSGASGSGFYSVSCSSTSDCAAAGSNGTNGVTTTTTDGGKVWSTPVAVSGTTTLHAVSCPSISECVAVGAYLVWNGTTYDTAYGVTITTTDGGKVWSTPVTVSGTVSLYGVSCPSISECVAVSNNTFAFTTDSGKTWPAKETTSIAGGHTAVNSERRFISCPSATNCTSVLAQGVFAMVLPTTTTIVASPNPAVVGQAVTYTTTARTSTGVPVTSGTVTFAAHGAAGVSGCTKATISSHGHARCDPTYASTGTYPVKATFSGTSALAASSGSTSLVVEAPAKKCPSGYTGSYPNCVAPHCPSGDTGTYPNCKPPAKKCPSADSGTYPNCVAATCPSADTGTYPNCVAPVVVKMAGFVAEKVPPNTVYPHRLRATVTRNGQPVAGYKVTFHLPVASGLTFDGPPVLVASSLTDTKGIATSPPIRAGATVGTFSATADGSGSVGATKGTVGSLGVVPVTVPPTNPKTSDPGGGSGFSGSGHLDKAPAAGCGG